MNLSLHTARSGVWIRNRLSAICLLIFSILTCAVLNGCSPESRLQNLAEDYVSLALDLDTLQQGEVDNYFGPENLRRGRDLSLPELAARAENLITEVESLELEDRSRVETLSGHLAHLENVIDFLQDQDAYTFAEEVGLLYGLPLSELPEDTRLDASGRIEIINLPPTESELRRRAITEELSSLLPGTGSLPFRVATFQSGYLVPVDLREQVFERALEACREATLLHWPLPEFEQLDVIWTRDVSTPWHTYLGDGRSEVKINPLALGYIGSMLDVACHEGYPGHHTQFLLLDQADLPVEETLVLLRSPRSALMEGAAEAGVDLAMPAAERQRLEEEVLFPLAGLATDQIETYFRINELLRQLSFAVVPIVQEYSDGGLPTTAAAVELERDAVVASPRAMLEFVDQYGGYTAGYTLAREKLESLLEHDSRNWNTLAEMIQMSNSEIRRLFAD